MKAMLNTQPKAKTSAIKRGTKIKVETHKAPRAEQGTCSICGRVYVEGGCNPFPLFPVQERCCHKCDAEIVLPARFYKGDNLLGYVAALISRGKCGAGKRKQA